MKEDLIKRFTSRKFLLALLGLLTVLFQDTIRLTPDQMNAVIALIIAFTAAEGVADAISRTSAPTAAD